MTPARPLRQKTIGILGGSSNVATGEYYRIINEISNDRLGGWDIAETLIAGQNFGNIEAMIRSDDWESLQDYMTGKVDGLIAGGADGIIGVSNTLHKVLVPIMAGRPDTHFIHIADPTGAAIVQAGLKRVALFGTAPTMAQPYQRERYEQKFGLEVVVPDATERADIDRIIFNELCRFVVTETSKARYWAIADRLARDEGVEGVIMGCTEIFTLMKPEDRPDFPLFNTTHLHCAAAVDWALA